MGGNGIMDGKMIGIMDRNGIMDGTGWDNGLDGSGESGGTDGNGIMDAIVIGIVNGNGIMDGNGVMDGTGAVRAGGTGMG